jgi:hypothetical protein
MANKLGYQYIPYSFIMGIAQGVFHNCDLDLKDTLAIDIKWKIYSERQKERKIQSPMILIDEQETHEKEIYKYFKDSTTKNCNYYMLARTQGRLKQEHLKLQPWTIGGQVWSTTCQM